MCLKCRVDRRHLLWICVLFFDEWLARPGVYGHAYLCVWRWEMRKVLCNQCFHVTYMIGKEPCVSGLCVIKVTITLSRAVSVEENKVLIFLINPLIFLVFGCLKSMLVWRIIIDFIYIQKAYETLSCLVVTTFHLARKSPSSFLFLK